MTTSIDLNPSYPTNLQREQGPNDTRMELMGPEGDTKLMFDKHNEDEVEAARATFKKLVKEKKYLAFKSKKDGTQGEQITEFDENVERVIMIPPLQGG